MISLQTAAQSCIELSWVQVNLQTEMQFSAYDSGEKENDENIIGNKKR